MPQHRECDVGAATEEEDAPHGRSVPPNDLTQTALGFSRDDVQGKFLARYINRKVVDRSPFETLDEPGVGQLVRMGAWLGRTARPALGLGVCGEHSGIRTPWTSFTTPSSTT